MEECSIKKSNIDQWDIKNMTPDEVSKSMWDNKSEDCMKVGLFINDFIKYNLTTQNTYQSFCA